MGSDLSRKILIIDNQNYISEGMQAAIRELGYVVWHKKYFMDSPPLLMEVDVVLCNEVQANQLYVYLVGHQATCSMIVLTRKDSKAAWLHIAVDAIEVPIRHIKWLQGRLHLWMKVSRRYKLLETAHHEIKKKQQYFEVVNEQLVAWISQILNDITEPETPIQAIENPISLGSIELLEELHSLVDSKIKAVKIQINKEHAQQVQQLQNAVDQLKELDRFKELLLTLIGHQLKTPLNGIQGSAQSVNRMLKKNTLTPERTEAYIQTILSASQDLKEMIDKVLEAARLEKRIELTFEEILLAPLIESVIEITSARSEAERLQFESKIPEDISVKADKKHLLQIFLYLMENAIKFTKMGTIRVQTETQHKHVIVSINDPGSGISEEKLPYIFQWFSQTDPSGCHTGIGLGLYICKKMIERMHGKIWVDSAVNQGSTFYLEIPLTQAYREV